MANEWKHRLTNIDADSLTADCAECGPVDVYYRKDKNHYICKVAKTLQAGNRYRFKDGTPRPRGELEKRVEEQNGLCALCLKWMESPQLDHCHATGTIRGALCRPCNLALGYLQDDVSTLLRAVEYLGKS